jgi:hypothetical protein
MVKKRGKYEAIFSNIKTKYNNSLNFREIINHPSQEYGKYEAIFSNIKNYIKQ